MNFAGLLLEAEKAGMRLSLNADRLRVDGDVKPSDELLDQLRQHKIEIIRHLRLVHAASFRTPPTDTLQTMLPPLDWPARRWKTFQADALTFCRDGWAAKADAAGWQAWELWGCHKQAPYGRIQGLGLVPMINGATLTGIDDTMAVIMTKSGSVQRYRRKQKDPLYPAERCLVWELA